VKRLFPILVLFCISSVAQTTDTKDTGNTPVATTSAPANPQSRRVMILVTATDHSGSPLTQLTEKDLNLTDNDQPGEVLSVKAANQLPLRVAIILLAGKTSFGQQQTAAAELVHKIIRSNIDRGFVLTARGDRPWPNPRIEWQSDPDSLEKSIRGLDKNAGLPDPFAFDMKTEDAGVDRHMTILQYGSQGTSVFNIMWAMMRSDPSPARHAVIIFRDPFAHFPGFGGNYTELVEKNHAQLIGDAQQLWTSFYIIGVQETQQLPKEFTDVYAPMHTGEGGYNRVYDQNLERTRERALDAGKINLERIANETGGGLWWSSKKNYPDAVAGIANQLNSQFAVTYAVHSDSLAGPKHFISVKSSNSGVRVVAQKTYFSRQVQPGPAQATSIQLQTRPEPPIQK
jgi:VWFA-related protein